MSPLPFPSMVIRTEKLFEPMDNGPEGLSDDIGPL